MSIKERKKKLNVNPFSVSFEIPINRQNKKGEYFLDGDIINIKEIEYEVINYTRIYTNHDFKDIVNKLSGISCKVYMWIIYSIYKQEDVIYIERARIMKELNIKSINTLKKAYDELCRYGFITPSIEKDIWWINPMFFFKGSRIVKYPKNVVVNNDYTI